MVKTTLKIDGMACSMCEAHINDCIRKNFKIKKIKTSHSKGVSEIISEKAPEEEKLKKAVSEIGYTILDLRSEEYKKKGLFS